MSTDDFAQRFADALVSEIKAEMGRQDLSSRGLGRLIDANSQYVSSRLDGGNPKTGERVPLNAYDISAMAHALGLSESELVKRAQAASRRSHLRAMNVGSRPDTDLETAELDSTLLAASTDDTPVSPDRGES